MSEAATKQEPRERPMIFTGESVRAILEGRKGMTRRVVKPQPEINIQSFGDGVAEVTWVDPKRVTNAGGGTSDGGLDVLQRVARDRCPYRRGDRLWVKETFQTIYERYDGQRFTEPPPRPPERRQRLWIEYAATPRDEHEPPRWKSPILMPRKYSRLTLEITNIRVERLQEISEEDARAEGVMPVDALPGAGPLYLFRQGWDELNAKRGFAWAVNPWVWCISFRVVEPRAGVGGGE